MLAKPISENRHHEIELNILKKIQFQGRRLQLLFVMENPSIRGIYITSTLII